MTAPLLMATATAIGRLTGKTPTEAQIAYDAMHTPSLTRPGKMMYRGRKTNDDVSLADARKLMENRGIATTVTAYGAGEDAEALDGLTAALRDPGTCLLVHLGGEIERTVVVMGVDAGRGEVTIEHRCATGSCDGAGAPQYGSEVIALDAFMRAWRSGGFTLMIAELTSMPAPPPGTWQNLRPRRESEDPARRRHARERGR